MNRSVLIAVFLAITVVFTAAAYFATPWLAGWAVHRYLAEKGFPDAQFSIESIGLTETVVTGFDLGGGSNVRARGIALLYSPGRLAGGIIDGVRIDQPEVPFAIGATGVVAGVLERFMETDDAKPAAPGVRLLGPLTVTAGLLKIATPLGEVDAAVEGVVLMTDGIGSDANIQFALQHPKASISGRLRGILDAADQLQLTLDIQNASSGAMISFDEMTGAVNIRGSLSGALDGGGSLSLQNVRVDGVALGNIDLVAQVDGKAATAEFLLGGSGTGISMQVRAETADIFDPAAKLHLHGEAATDGLKGPLKLPLAIDVVGAMDFDVSGSRRDLQALPAQISTGAVRAVDGISGEVDLTHLGLAAPNGVNATLDGKLELAVDTGGWRLKPVAGVHFDLGLPEGAAERRFDLSLGNIAGVPFLAGGPSAADPLRLGAVFDGMYNGWFAFSGDAGGTVWPATTDGVVLEDVAIRFDPWQTRIGGLAVVAEQIGVHLSGPFRQLDLEAAIEARFDGKLGNGMDIGGGQVSLTGNVGYAADGIRVYPNACLELRASQISLDGAVLRPGPVAVCPRGDGAPVLHAVMDDAGLKRVDLAAVLKSTEIALDGAGPYVLSGTLPRLEGSASFDAARGTWWAKMASKGGALRVEGPDVALADVDATFSLEGRDHVLGARLEIGSALIADQHRPLRFVPATLKGKGQYQPSSVSFAGDVSLPKGPNAVIDARYRTPDKRGSVQIQLPTWEIVPGSPQPQALLPVLKGVIAEVSGAISGEARIGWSAERVTSTAKASLQNLAFGTKPVEVAGLNGEIVLADLIGLKSDGSQSLTLALLDAGLPLRDGTIKFDLPGDARLHIERASWPVAGGTLEISDLNVPFDSAPQFVIANLKGLDAGMLARNIDVDGLEADGMLAGSIPVRITGDGPVIDDARISSVKNGTLRFRSSAALQSLKQSGEMADLLARALADFRYNDLQVSLDGPLSGDITAKAKINGANPALYDGKRIELNVTLQGALRDLLQSASVIQDLPEKIRDRVQGPSGNP
jgi:hypothetical protein